MENTHEHFTRAIKWVYNPRDRGPDRIRTFLFVNPLIILVIIIMADGFGPGFWRHYLYGLLVGEGVALVCVLCSWVVSLVGFRLLKIEVKPRTFFMINAAALTPGIWFGFFVADSVFQLLGRQRPAHSYSDYSSGLMMGGVFLVLFAAMDLWLSVQKRAKRLETENLQAKLSALSAQMNPHLLFNALNTIASTIPSDPRAAEETTLKLSELYRGILSSSQRASHPLSSELDICRAYLSIEKSRFGERLKWSIESDPELNNLEIPTLLLQPLVENAIKHGTSPKAEGCQITVRIWRENGFVDITIEDDGIGYGNSRQSGGTKTGVSSCRARLELLYWGEASFEISKGLDGIGTRVQIRFPERVSS